MSFNEKDLPKWRQFLINYSRGGVSRLIIIFTLVGLISSFFIGFLGRFTAQLFGGQVFQEKSFVVSKNINSKPIEFSETNIVDLNNGEKDLYISADNILNSEIGFSPFAYSYQIQDNQGKVLDEGQDRTFILPEELKYFVVRTDQEEASRLIITQLSNTREIIYNPDENNLTKEPKITVTDNKFSESGDFLLLEIGIKNDDVFDVKEVEITYLIRDTRQTVVGINKTKVNNLRSGDTKDVKIRYPKPENRIPRFLEVRTSVNFLDPELTSL